MPIQDRERTTTFRCDSYFVSIERAQRYVSNDGKKIDQYGFLPVRVPIDDGDTEGNHRPFPESGPQLGIGDLIWRDRRGKHVTKSGIARPAGEKLQRSAHRVLMDQGYGGIVSGQHAFSVPKLYFGDHVTELDRQALDHHRAVHFEGREPGCAIAWSAAACG